MPLPHLKCRLSSPAPANSSTHHQDVWPHYPSEERGWQSCGPALGHTPPPYLQLGSTGLGGIRPGSAGLVLVRLHSALFGCAPLGLARLSLVQLHLALFGCARHRSAPQPRLGPAIGKGLVSTVEPVDVEQWVASRRWSCPEAFQAAPDLGKVAVCCVWQARHCASIQRGPALHQRAWTLHSTPGAAGHCSPLLRRRGGTREWRAMSSCGPESRG